MAPARRSQGWQSAGGGGRPAAITPGTDGTSAASGNGGGSLSASARPIAWICAWNSVATNRPTGGNQGGPDSVLLADPNGEVVGALGGGGRGWTGQVFGVTGLTVTAAPMGSAGAQVAAPEPATLALFGLGLAGLRVVRHRRS